MNGYPVGLKVSDKEMETLHLGKVAFHGEWDYTLIPGARLQPS